MTQQTIYGFKTPEASQPAIFFDKETRDRDMPARAEAFESVIEVPNVRRPTPKSKAEVIRGFIEGIGWGTLMWTGMGWTGQDQFGEIRTFEDKEVIEWREFKLDSEDLEGALQALWGRIDILELGMIVDPLAWSTSAYQDRTERTAKQAKAMGTASAVVHKFIKQVTRKGDEA
jgi:hypothetical protein